MSASQNPFGDDVTYHSVPSGYTPPSRFNPRLVNDTRPLIQPEPGIIKSTIFYIAAFGLASIGAMCDYDDGVPREAARLTESRILENK